MCVLMCTLHCLLLQALLLLLAASYAHCTRWRWCGTIRPASSRYSLARESAGECMHTSTGGAGLRIGVGGAMQCVCPPWADYSTPQIVNFNVTVLRDGEGVCNATVTIANPCLTAVCESNPVSPLVLAENVTTLGLHPPLCGISLYRHHNTVNVETKDNTFACSALDQSLLITTAAHSHPDSGSPAVLVTQAIPLHTASCSKDATTVALHPYPSPRQPSHALRRMVNHAPRFDEFHYTETVLENSPIGTMVTTVRANDPDVGDQLSYSWIADVAHSHDIFELNSETGVVTTTGKLAAYQ